MRITRNALAAAIAAAGVLPLWAQQAQKVEKIEVTGSNIKRVDAEGPAPVQVLSRQDIERSGANTVSDVLRKYGVTVTTCANGNDAIAQVEQNDFELVISDIKMPDRTGYDVFAATRRRSGECSR